MNFFIFFGGEWSFWGGGFKKLKNFLKKTFFFRKIFFILPVLNFTFFLDIFGFLKIICFFGGGKFL
jgi:hypothetical protein